MKNIKPLIFLTVLIVAFATAAYHSGYHNSGHSAESANVESVIPWQLSEHQDAMTDRKSIMMSVNGFGYDGNTHTATLLLECFPEEVVSIYSGEDFFNKPDEYRVTYRVDKRDAVFNQYWSAENKYAISPNISEFIADISGGSILVMDVFIPIDSRTYRYEFNIYGFDKAMQSFKDKCSKIAP